VGAGRGGRRVRRVFHGGGTSKGKIDGSVGRAGVDTGGVFKMGGLNAKKKGDVPPRKRACGRFIGPPDKRTPISNKKKNEKKPKGIKNLGGKECQKTKWTSQ